MDLYNDCLLSAAPPLKVSLTAYIEQFDKIMSDKTTERK